MGGGLTMRFRASAIARWRLNRVGVCVSMGPAVNKEMAVGEDTYGETRAQTPVTEGTMI
jgi:hypothetical protein